MFIKKEVGYTGNQTKIIREIEVVKGSNQRPQVMQVTVSKRIRSIQCGGVAINFVYKKDISQIPTQSLSVPTGYLILSTPEATVMDLLLYTHHLED